MSEVGSGIINVITESLYDNPIVVFREYVQNAVDSIFKSKKENESDIKIFYSEDILCFADNGNGIDADLFDGQMGGIAKSVKTKQKNLGYKGIGRLSGLPYCDSLKFFNIIDYKQNIYQKYFLDGKRYADLKNSEEIQNLNVEQFLQLLSEDNSSAMGIDEYIGKVEGLMEYFQKYNKGFLVIMEEISPVLKHTIESDKFVGNLSWLLPVDFSAEIYGANSKISTIVSSLKADNQEGAAARFCNIFYNGNQVLRPISTRDFRNTVFKNDFEYAVGMITFNGQKIQIEKNNRFSGIRIYIDNMLLCDESELIPALANYGLLHHSVNGMIQTVRGIGAMIYITDKTNISANARRTFFEVTDYDSLRFLQYLAEFVNNLYDARYALSNYASALRDREVYPEEVDKKKEKALILLCKIVNEKVAIEEIEIESNMSELTEQEKKVIVKKSIVSRINKELKEYIKQYDVSNTETYYEEFIDWLERNR